MGSVYIGLDNLYKLMLTRIIILYYVDSSILVYVYIRIRIRIRIYLLARRNLLWDILRLPSSHRAALGLYVILTL